MREVFLSSSCLLRLLIHKWQTLVSSNVNCRRITVGERGQRLGHNVYKFKSDDYKSVGVINCLGKLVYLRLLWLNFTVLIISGLTDFGLGFGLYLGSCGLQLHSNNDRIQGQGSHNDTRRSVEILPWEGYYCGMLTGLMQWKAELGISAYIYSPQGE